MKQQQPLIILGMHRSGTSMLTRLLRHQGVFLGHKIQGDDEATFFLELNRWIMRVGGSDWDRPLPVLEMLEDEEHVERIAEYCRQRLTGPQTYEFLGMRAFAARFRIGTDLPYPWGFKDPRTSITLPVWLRLFPQAKLLRIRRHGIDVAASLRNRYFNAIRPRLGSYTAAARHNLSYPGRNHIVGVTRCARLAGGLEMWAEYESAIDRHLAGLSESQHMTLRYEDYIQNFAELHPQVAAFAGIDADVPIPTGISPDPRKAFAYRNNAEDRAAEPEFAGLLARHGY